MSKQFSSESSRKPALNSSTGESRKARWSPAVLILSIMGAFVFFTGLAGVGGIVVIGRLRRVQHPSSN